MAALFQLNNLSPQIKPGTRLLKAGEAKIFLEARELSQALRDRLQALEESLLAQSSRQKEAAAAERQKILAEAQKEGRAEGLSEYTFKILDAVTASVDYLENLETDLVKIVGEAVRKILGELPPEELAVKVVKKALLSLRQDRQVLVRISPQDEPAVREAFLGLDGSGSGYLQVRSDGRLAPGQCILESELGLVEASLETQLANLEKSLKNQVQKEK